MEGLDDIEIQLGDDLPSPRVSYDDTKVVSVSLDTSKVDKSTIGVYTISYIIKGVDGTTTRTIIGYYQMTLQETNTKQTGLCIHA